MGCDRIGCDIVLVVDGAQLSVDANSVAVAVLVDGHDANVGLSMI